MPGSPKTFETAAKRWEGIGPYYAMFPTRFAESVIRRYTAPGDVLLDPFAGRGTAVFSAVALGRIGYGIEISPVGWVYATTKLAPAPYGRVQKRLIQVADRASQFAHDARALPQFFRGCFSLDVRMFLLAARSELDWRRCSCDRTLMAILLVYLHGKLGAALSNQMRQTKAMSPDYAVKWWNANGMKPPAVDPVEFMKHRIEWRYAKGILEQGNSKVLLGDSALRIPDLARCIHTQGVSKPSLLLTSPPYFGVTNYHYDQWLRLWLLGFEPTPYMARGPHRGRFRNPAEYRALLRIVFSRAAQIVAKDAVVYVRTGRDKITRSTTLDALREAFPVKHVRAWGRPFGERTQTYLFGDKTPKVGEIDFILSAGSR